MSKRQPIQALKGSQNLTKATVRFFSEEVFDINLPEKYDKKMFQAKCDMTFMHVYDVYGGWHPVELSL